MIEIIFLWTNICIGGFWDKKEKSLCIMPFPMIAIIIKFSPFTNWMNELKEEAFKWDPKQYPKDSMWMDEYFKKTYYDQSFTPKKAWEDYTTMRR